MRTVCVREVVQLYPRRYPTSDKAADKRCGMAQVLIRVVRKEVRNPLIRLPGSAELVRIGHKAPCGRNWRLFTSAVPIGRGPYLPFGLAQEIISAFQTGNAKKNYH